MIKDNSQLMVRQILKIMEKNQLTLEEDESESKSIQTNTMHSITHIYRLFGLFGINQKTIENPGIEESFFYNHFQGRSIQKVEFYNNCIVIQLSAPQIPFYQPSVEYLIERFKSKGDKKFYEIAEVIENISETFSKIQNHKPAEQKSESIKKGLDLLGDSMFVCCLGPKKVAISKSLLTYLEYDVEQFAVEILKYRTITQEFFSSLNYAAGLKHLLQVLIHLVNLNLGKISLSQFHQLSTYRFSDFIESKTHVKSYCNMSFTFLNPAYCLHKIDYIYYKEGAPSVKKDIQDPMRLAIQAQKGQIRQEEYQVLKKVKNIPISLLKENQKKFAGYKQVLQQKCIETENFL